MKPTCKLNQAPELTSASDEELLLSYRDGGNRLAFEELVHRFEKELFGYLRNYLSDPELAEDAFQETWKQVYLKCDQFDHNRKFRPWLYAVATNQAIDLQRKLMRHPIASLNRVVQQEAGESATFGELFADEAAVSSEETAMRMEGSALVHAALEALDPAQRDVVKLVYFQGLRYREAAVACDIPIGTVKSRMHAAIVNLGVALGSNPIPA